MAFDKEEDEEEEYNEDGRLVKSPSFQAETRWRSMQRYTGTEAAALLIWNTIVDNKPVVTGVSAVHKYYGDADDIIKNIAVTKGDSRNENSKYWWFELGSLFDAVTGILKDRNLGIRCIRPMDPAGQVFSFGPNGGPRRTYKENIKELQFNIYSGINRSIEQTQNDPLVFSYAAGHIQDPSSIVSTVGTSNVVIVDSTATGKVVTVTRKAKNSPTGFSRRVKRIQAQSRQEKAVESDEAESGNDANYKQSMSQEGRRELARQKPQAVLDFLVSENCPYEFGVDYRLGDQVTVISKYKVEMTMYVSKFTEIWDTEGYRRYPTLTLRVEGEEEYDTP